MAKIRTLKPRFATLARSTGRQASRQSADEVIRPWRPLYRTAQWQRLRRVIFERDGYQCQRSGVLLIGKAHAWNSPVLDHVIPAHVFWFDGRQHLFWEPDNLQALSKREHDIAKQAEERAGRGGVASWAGKPR